MENRTYAVKDPETVRRLQAEYLEKIRQNKINGAAALSNGEFTPYKGVSEKLQREQFMVMLLPDSESETRITEEVVKPLEELTTSLSVPSIFAGKGALPLHVTLDVGDYQGVSEEQIEKVNDWLLSNQSHLKPLKKILDGLTFHMDTLVVAPNSYVCASKFGEEQGAAYRSRKIIENVMRKSISRPKNVNSEPPSLAPSQRYDDIFYASVARITGKAPEGALIEFLHRANSTIGENIKKNPIRITVQRVYMGSPIDFYKAEAPQLLI